MAGNRDIDSMRFEPLFASEAREVESVAAPCIQNDVARCCANHPGDTPKQWLGYAAIVQSAPRRHRLRRITWMLGFLSCGWSRLMYPLRAMSKECPRAQTTRFSSRANSSWQPRTGQRSMLDCNQTDCKMACSDADTEERSCLA